MTENRIAPEQIMGFARHLRQAERSPGTIENYNHYEKKFGWLPLRGRERPGGRNPLPGVYYGLLRGGADGGYGGEVPK